MFIALTWTLTVNAQGSKPQVTKKIAEGIKLRDGGKSGEAYAAFEEAQALDPDSKDVRFQIAYTHFVKADDMGLSVSKWLKSPEGIDNVSQEAFEMRIGNYKLFQLRDKAIAAYEEGVKKYPGYGPLYFQRGWMEYSYSKGRPDRGLEFFEKGVVAAPAYANNYYYSAVINCDIGDKMWGLIYGEYFMNLNRNTVLTDKMSKLLCDTYSTYIATLVNNGQLKKGNSTYAGIPGSNNSFKDDYLFGLGYGIQAVDDYQLKSLVEIGSRFAGHTSRFNKKNRIALFEYLLQIKLAGQSRCYYYWLLGADSKDASQWISENKAAWNMFIAWFIDHPFVINQNNKLDKAKL